jgi:hypothetical protein
MIKKLLHKMIVCGAFALGLASCNNVEEGYRKDYTESTAEFVINELTLNRGAIGDSVKFEIIAHSGSDIKSIIATSSTTGKDGSGFKIKSGTTDPLIDHTYGTIQKGTSDLDLYYTYVIAQDTTNVTIAFTMIDTEGKKSSSHTILTVPAIKRYSDVILYSSSASKTDGFSTADGKVYKNLSNYESITAANQSVQETIDIIFRVNNNSAMLVAPYDGNFSSNFTIKNKTKFRKMKGITVADFAELTNASFSYFVDKDTVSNGSTHVSDIKVGDFIGYRTDFASANSYKYGIIKVNSIHPANCDWYDGISYMFEMEVVTQIKKD